MVIAVTRGADCQHFAQMPRANTRGKIPQDWLEPALSATDTNASCKAGRKASFKVGRKHWRALITVSWALHSQRVHCLCPIRHKL